MPEDSKSKKYDLEERTLNFARNVRQFIAKLHRTAANIEDGKQLLRSSGSVGANYIEANEALSKKDFLMRIKISRKEAKESEYWLKLIVCQPELENDRLQLLDESVQFRKIFGAIIEKTQV